VLDNSLDIISGDKHSKETVSAFNDFKNTCALNDVWRIFNPDLKEFSWSRKSNFVARRIDYCLASDKLLNQIVEGHMKSVPYSDHRYMYVEVKCSQIERGPGYWKFNNDLLRDLHFVQFMNTVIDSSLGELVECDAQLKWELLKRHIKDESIEYSKNRAIKRKNDRIQLYDTLNECDQKLSKDPQNQDLIDKRQSICMQLEIYEKLKTQSAMTRARIKWIEEGEKKSFFFLSLEKSRANAKS
jgi:hypothetical protein